MPRRGGEFPSSPKIETSEPTATESSVDASTNMETGAAAEPEALPPTPVESATVRIIDITARISSRNGESSEATEPQANEAESVLGEIGKDTLGIVPPETIKETPSRQALELAQSEGDPKIGDKITAFGNKYVPEAWLANKIKEKGGVKGILKSALSYLSDKATERQEARHKESKAQKSKTAETSPNPESAQAKIDAKVEAYRKKLEAEHSVLVRDEANSLNNTLSGDTAENSPSPSVESTPSVTTSGNGGGGNYLNLGNIDTGDEAWDAKLRQSREKAEAKRQRARERQSNRQARKEQRMLERRQNWAELKDKVNKKWYVKLGKKAFKFARKTAAIAKGMYEGGRAAHADFDKQGEVQPTTNPTLETSTAAASPIDTQPTANNVFSLDAARERRQTETTAEKSPEDSEKEPVITPDAPQTMYSRRSNIHDDGHSGSVRLRSVPRSNSAENAA